MLRIIRPDRISLAVDKFVTEQFNNNEHFVNVIYLKSKWLLE